MDVLDDRVDIAITKHLAEGWHCALFSILDPVSEKLVASLRIHQLRAPARNATALAVTEAAS
jgi:hypothetical protein